MNDLTSPSLADDIYWAHANALGVESVVLRAENTELRTKNTELRAQLAETLDNLALANAERNNQRRWLDAYVEDLR